ncbi:hypothetical protein ASG35_03010 [Burkholderia sp. Leaf177]|uniref:hypothetical protein n=1 Tax=Burkholderia sp. Leaf177 TaxID=1736287 RepID=UPI0006F65367|nr:hypothetical protein [Burkholderia sp. Leaf177]KQR90195.1 hypothetical protein ASG35_03010 [Burkholderia sp. Leaf177]
MDDKTVAGGPHVVFDIVDDGPPEFQMAPAGAIVWIEVDPSEPRTLLVDPVPHLVCDSLLGIQVQRLKKTEIATGRVEWYFESLPYGDTGEISQYYCIERPNGVITYSDGRLQTAEERAQLLAAKKRFFSGE